MKMDQEFDKIYFISSNKDDDNYDSIDVIDERRSSNFQRSGAAAASGFCRSSTVIYSEYCSGSTMESAVATPETRPTVGTRSTADDTISGVESDDDAAGNKTETASRSAEGIEVEVEVVTKGVELRRRLNSQSSASDDDDVGGETHPIGSSGQTTQTTTITVRADVEDCSSINARSPS